MTGHVTMSCDPDGPKSRGLSPNLLIGEKAPPSNQGLNVIAKISSIKGLRVE